MDDNKENPNLPPPLKPMSSGQAILLGVAVGGIVAGIGGLLSSKLTGLKGSAFWHKVAEWAGLGAGAGAVMGSVENGHIKTEYDLTVDNTRLQNEIKRLKPYESYAKEMEVKKLEQKLESPIKQ